VVELRPLSMHGGLRGLSSQKNFEIDVCANAILVYFYAHMDTVVKSRGVLPLLDTLPVKSWSVWT